MEQQTVMSIAELGSTKRGKTPKPDVTTQDYIDFVWQSAIKARDSGVAIEFVVLNDDEVGVKISGVSFVDGRPMVKGQ